jgi:hypothetical protein
VREGLKLLAVEAPPQRLLASLPALLGGSESAELDRRGYRRWDPAMVRIAPPSFILDGEQYDGGPLLIRQGAPIDFVVP